MTSYSVKCERHWRTWMTDDTVPAERLGAWIDEQSELVEFSEEEDDDE